MSRLISIGTKVPDYKSKQVDILAYMKDAYKGSALGQRTLHALFEHSGIDARYSVVSDFSSNKDNGFFKREQKQYKPDVGERSDHFTLHALPLALDAVTAACGKLGKGINELHITHLITVSCTGLTAPGLDVELVQQLQLPPDIFRTSVNFLGCNAVFHALKIADMIGKTDPEAVVLIVSVELCTLHFVAQESMDALFANTIFADGAAAAIVCADEKARSNHWKGFSMRGLYSILADEGKYFLTWNIMPESFVMGLNSKIPELIGAKVAGLVNKSLEKFNIDRSEISAWAVHPGGKKILDAIVKSLGLHQSDLKISYKILQDYGNMSSATILFVLQEIIDQASTGNVFTLGFGPGLSMDTALFSYAG